MWVERESFSLRLKIHVRPCRIHACSPIVNDFSGDFFKQQLAIKLSAEKASA